MASEDKKKLIKNLNNKFRSPFGLKDPRGKKKAMSLKAYFSIWHHLYCYGNERSQFNSFKGIA
jgi:hypothetical protein